MTPTAFPDHFSSRAEGYAAFRPDYPEALFEWVAALAPARGLAWDAGTGNGQAAVGLARHFTTVVATDASRQQLAHARHHPRVRYQLGREAASGLADTSADLVTAAQALHWFDIPAFFREARRVLKPDGAIAVWTYTRPSLDDAVLDGHLRAHGSALATWWPPERALVDSGYRTLAFPFAEVPAPPFEIEAFPLRDELTGYLRTWSAHARYVEANAVDPVIALERKLAPLWPSYERRRMRWPLHLRAGRPA